MLSPVLAEDIQMKFGKTNIGAVLSAVKTEAGWGLQICGRGTASASQAKPFSLEFGQGAAAAMDLGPRTLPPADRRRLAYGAGVTGIAYVLSATLEMRPFTMQTALTVVSFSIGIGRSYPVDSSVGMVPSRV